MEKYWFAIRSVFRHEVEGDNAYFEENIVLYHAESVEDAFKCAAKDAANYLDMNAGFIHLKHVGAYRLGDQVGDFDGAEVWSQLSRGPADPEDYFHEKYGKYERFDTHDDDD